MYSEISFEKKHGNRQMDENKNYETLELQKMKIEKKAKLVRSKDPETMQCQLHRKSALK